MPQRKILLTGATGYVGGRLLPRLEAQGHAVRCFTRRPDDLRSRVGKNTEVVGGDLMVADDVKCALDGMEVAFYLAHALDSSEGFESAERKAAVEFASAAREAGVQRIVYLGGLGSRGADSPHLRSRHEVGQVLHDSGVPTIEFRASIVLGSGSASFEMIRSLVDKLPVMVTPSWVRNLAQPIGIEDVLEYLLSAVNDMSHPAGIYQIGGPDQVSYLDLMREYAKQRGLTRFMIPVPFLTPRLSSLWLGLVTPVYARVGRKLIDSIRHDTVVENDRALTEFDVAPRGYQASIHRALIKEDRDFAETRWSDALGGSSRNKYGGVQLGRRLIDTRSLTAKTKRDEAFAPIQRIGGNVGWYYATWLWRVRGFVDLLVGGVGLRRGRRDANHLSVGDTVDWWRVEAVEPGKLLRLRAEMKLPGRAWLQFELTDDQVGTKVTQTAIFDPLGAFGLLYWYTLYPFHSLIFRGMLRNIVRSAEHPVTPAQNSLVSIES